MQLGAGALSDGLAWTLPLDGGAARLDRARLGWLRRSVGGRAVQALPHALDDPRRGLVQGAVQGSTRGARVASTLG
jgi:hypothetical protein